MKFNFVALISLLVFSLSANALDLSLPIGMKVVPQAPVPLIVSEVEPKAEMACGFYNTRIEDGLLKESETLLSQKTLPFTVGYAVFWKIQLPAPHQDMNIVFNHMMSGYRETGNVMSPFLQAYFKKDKKMLDYKDISFDVGNVQSGSKILLRGYFNYSSTSLLTYQCTFNYL